MCSLTGVAFNHSSDELILLEEIGFRVVETPSQMIHMNKMTATKEIRDPSEDTIFQVMKASG